MPSCGAAYGITVTNEIESFARIDRVQKRASFICLGLFPSSFVFGWSVVPAAAAGPALPFAGDGVVTGGAGKLSAIAEPGHVKNSAKRPIFTWSIRNASLQIMQSIVER